MHINDLSQKINKHYDRMMYEPIGISYFQESEFSNHGYWEEGTTNGKQASENLMEKLLSSIPEKKGNILDVACGKGGTTRYLTKYYQPEDIAGINISEKQLASCAANVPGATFRCMNATDLKFDDSSWDNIICVEAAHHFDTREQFLKEAYRVLKPGGWLVICDMLVNREGYQRIKSFVEKNYVADPKEYEAVLHRVGFKEIAVVDATEECWKRHFLYVMNFLNKNFLEGKIEIETLKKYLDFNYDKVSYMQYYVLASARKGVA